MIGFWGDEGFVGRERIKRKQGLNLSGFVAARPLYLQLTPNRVFRSASAKDSTRQPLDGKCASRRRISLRANPPPGEGHQQPYVPLGPEPPLPAGAANGRGGAHGVASRPDSELRGRSVIIQRHGKPAPLAFQPKRDDQLCESNGSLPPYLG
ncbi:hypothetical protein GmHk_U060155 [Glycine max]|nr:hypothetical protein GmHk_U060155 [Glycine max]